MFTLDIKFRITILFGYSSQYVCKLEHKQASHNKLTLCTMKMFTTHESTKLKAFSLRVSKMENYFAYPHPSLFFL